MNSARLKAYINLFLVSLIWGAASPIIKFTLGGIAALPFLTYRFGISSVVALISIFVRGIKIPKDFSTTILIIAYGIMTTTISLGLLFLGMEKTTVLDATLISAVAPLFIAVAGAMLLKEHVTGKEKIGISIAFLGTLITAVQPLFESASTGTGITSTTGLIGNLLIIGYLIANTASAVWAKKLVRLGVDEINLTNISFVIGFITLAPLAIYKYGLSDIIHTILNLQIPYHLGVFYMALLSGTLAYTLWVKGQKTIEIGEAGLFSYLYPVLGAPLAVYWLGEKITPTFVVGAVLIAIGVIIAEVKRKKKD